MQEEVIIIRDAEIKDISHIKELLIQLYDTISVHEGLDPQVIDHNVVDACPDDNSMMLVAESGNTIIGMIYTTYHQSLLHPGPSACIEEFIVHKDFRGSGMGRLLMNKCIEIVREKGCSEIEVSTEFTNKKAISFYAGYGFEKVGILFEKELDT